MKIEKLFISTTVIVNICLPTERSFHVMRELSVDEVNSFNFKECIIHQMNIISNDFIKNMAQNGYEF